MARRDHPDGCPIARTAGLVGDIWMLLILRDLGRGHCRFGELLLSLEGVSSRTLSGRLKMLEAGGVILRESYAEIPPRVEYALTEKGEALLPLVEEMRRFGEEWLPRSVGSGKPT